MGVGPRKKENRIVRVLSLSRRVFSAGVVMYARRAGGCCCCGGAGGGHEVWETRLPQLLFLLPPARQRILERTEAACDRATSVASARTFPRRGRRALPLCSFSESVGMFRGGPVRPAPHGSSEVSRRSRDLAPDRARRVVVVDMTAAAFEARPCRPPHVC